MGKQIHIMVVCATTMLTACGGTWDIQTSTTNSESQVDDNNEVVIERYPDRKSPHIKTFRHIDFNIYKESAGSRHNYAYARSSVKTPPGNIQIGVILGADRVYYPEIEFISEPKHKYFITWVCIPYPFVAIVDAESSTYVGIDSYCPDCEGLVGSQINESSQCLNFWHPTWMQSDPEHHWLPWFMERTAQMYRNLCVAADNGVISAQRRLGLLYGSGIYGVIEDKIRSYVWYQLAADNGDDESAMWVENYRNANKLSASELMEAEQLLADWQKGQCSKELLGEWRPKYELEIN